MGVATIASDTRSFVPGKNMAEVCLSLVLEQLGCLLFHVSRLLEVQPSKIGLGVDSFNGQHREGSAARKLIVATATIKINI